MSTDHFNDLLAETGTADVTANLALHFYEAGRAFALTEIRQKAIAEAERLEELPDIQVDRLTARSDALRTFAAGLIGLAREAVSFDFETEGWRPASETVFQAVERIRADFDTALAAFVVECKGVRDGSAT